MCREGCKPLNMLNGVMYFLFLKKKKNLWKEFFFHIPNFAWDKGLYMLFSRNNEQIASGGFWILHYCIVM